MIEFASPRIERPVFRWGVLSRSDSRLDGKREFVMWEAGAPLLFHTRRAARVYIRERYGYIKDRPDLRAEPYGWKTPLAIRVSVTIVAT